MDGTQSAISRLSGSLTRDVELPGYPCDRQSYHKLPKCMQTTNSRVWAMLHLLCHLVAPRRQRLRGFKILNPRTLDFLSLSPFCFGISVADFEKCHLLLDPAWASFKHDFQQNFCVTWSLSFACHPYSWRHDVKKLGWHSAWGLKAGLSQIWGSGRLHIYSSLSWDTV